MQLKMQTCSIGVLCYNEAKNIEKLLTALLNQKLETVTIEEIIVVSSASSDGTDEIVAKIAKEHPKIRLIQESERKGKSSSINTFITQAKSEILVIESGDTIPAKNTIEKLVSAFSDPEIGMTGGRPLPENNITTWTGYSVNLLWKLHHKMALQEPKLGEMIAFRKIFSSIPEESAVDEASIEAEIKKNHLKKKYIPTAIIHNKGPETFSEFIKQRRRIATGHLWLKQTENYSVSSQNPKLLLQLAIEEACANPLRIVNLIFTMKMEILARILGWYDFHIAKKNPYKWEMIKTSKKLKWQNKND